MIGEIFNKKELPETRMIIAGNPVMLAKILNKKFNCLEFQESVLLEILKKHQIFSEFLENFINSIKKKKMETIRKFLNDTHFYVEGLETIIYEEKLKQNKSHNIRIPIEKPSLLQNFVYKLNEKLPECLPIDIFLDLSNAELINLFKLAKYALKYDDKGWAFNSSSLLMSYGMDVFYILDGEFAHLLK